MRIETLLPIFLICVLTACDTGCSAEQESAARRTLSESFNQWRHALDFMDEGIIEAAYSDLLSCAGEARQCLDVDTAALYQLESVNATFSQHRPSRESILEAERLISELEDQLLVR